jgi:type II secretory pathway pseudopilin PulG
VELLVVIAIIGILVALLLPAIQAARESARLAQCKNNLRQIALAMLQHETANQAFPAGGWSSAWIGDPNVGTGARQPGGWIYQSLPYLEQQALHDIGLGLTGPNLISALTKQSATPLSIFNCPTRRPSQLYQTVELLTWNFRPVELAAKTDYAANAGSNAGTMGGPGPRPKFPFVFSNCEGGYPNCAWSSNQTWFDQYWTGIVGDHSGATILQITDGTSTTLLVGEKWLYELYYDIGTIDAEFDNQTNGIARDNPGDNGVMYAGIGYDNVRACGGINGGPQYPPMRDSDYNRSNPQSDKKGAHYQERFGSAHPAGLNIARCDGSVDTEGFDVDPTIWAGLGTRNDGAL